MPISVVPMPVIEPTVYSVDWVSPSLYRLAYLPVLASFPASLLPTYTLVYRSNVPINYLGGACVQ